MKICSIILSAGKGSRMLSSTPKPLHTISGKTMLQWVIDANQSAGIKKSIIVAPQEFDKFDIKNKNVIKTIQKKPLGTGDAVRKGASLLDNFEGAVLICFADTPFITPKTLKKIVNSLNNDNDLVLTGFRKFDKNKYGKIIFDKNKKPYEIIEYKDNKRNKVDSIFCNGGIMGIHSSCLTHLNKIRKNSLSGEFYLTDIVKILSKENKNISFIEIDEEEIIGINNQLDLSIAEGISQNLIRNKAMMNGVKLIDPNSTFINYDTKFGKDIIIQPNVVFGNNVVIDSFVEIKSFSYIEECKIKKGSIIGPFARIRGGTIIGESSKIGNFVEIKKSNISNEVKINHLSYIGDTEIGSSTNIGAGTITCNYDGKKKNKTRIGKDSFVGSNSTIIAPIKIGDNVTMGAGSVFNKSIPNNNLSIGRAYQINKKYKKN
jgi:bifunctional UDP-N-acetylglucosamine pyrophosphorylase/glucosamine-1-phosphate N-acetyltransferase